MRSDIQAHNIIVITGEGRRLLYRFQEQAESPTQKMISLYSGLSPKTIRKVLKQEPCKLESVELLYTTLAAISRQAKIPLKNGIHYTRVKGKKEFSNPIEPTSTKDMAYQDLLNKLIEQESQGKVGMVVDQKSNQVLMSPSNLLMLNQERFILTPMQWLKPKPFDFTGYWEISGSGDELQRIQSLQPGESTESEHKMFRVPRLVEREWYTDLCRYYMTFYCIDLGYTQARVSRSNPKDYEIIRPASKQEINKLLLL